MAEPAKSIFNLSFDLVVNRLVQELMTEVADDDPSQPGTIRAGKLQADPQKGRINLLVHPGDEGDPHVLNTNSSGPDASAYTYAIGSTLMSMWRYRYKIQLKIMLKEKSRDNARKIAHVVLSRAKRAIATTPYAGITDDFGESLSMIQVYEMELRESGGPGNFIWNGVIKFEFLVSSNYPKEVIP